LWIVGSSFGAAQPRSGFDKEQHALKELLALGGIGGAQEFLAKLPQALNIRNRPTPLGLAHWLRGKFWHPPRGKVHTLNHVRRLISNGRLAKVLWHGMGSLTVPR
jgi:hypothetical protein